MKSGIMKKTFFLSALIMLMTTVTAQSVNDMLLLSSINKNNFADPSLKVVLANNNIAEISWHALPPINVLRYELEKSADAKNFTYVTALPSKNNVGGNYNFKDKYLFEGTNYYRLKIVDAKGNYLYTNVVSFNRNELADQVKILSPLAGKELIIWTPANTHLNKVIIKDMMNRDAIITNDVSGSTNLSSIDISNLSSGLYKVVLYTSEGVYTNLKFSKK